MFNNSVIINGEEWLICPIDKNHKTPARKYEYHMRKCSLNSNCEVSRCHFNAKHYVLKNEVSEHMKICPDRDRVNSLLEQTMYDPVEDTRFIAIKNYTQSTEDCDEDWDKEIKANMRQPHTSFLKTSYKPPSERKREHDEYIKRCKEKFNAEKEKTQEEPSKKCHHSNGTSDNNLELSEFDVNNNKTTSSSNSLNKMSFANAAKKPLGRGAGRGLLLKK